MLAKSLADPWIDWRERVVAIIRRDFQGELSEVGDDDIDWEAWRPLYEKGYSAEVAVDCAFLRNVERPVVSDEEP